MISSKLPLLAGVAVAAFSASAQAFTHYSSDSDSCIIIGDGDLYGIGVRLGLYLQWFAIFIACGVSPDDAIAAFITSNILTLSLWIAFLSGDWARNENLVILEWVIVQHETFALYAGLTLPILVCYGSMGNGRIMWLTTSMIYALPAFSSPYILINYVHQGRRDGCKYHLDAGATTVSAVILCTLSGIVLLWNFRPLLRKKASNFETPKTRSKFTRFSNWFILSRDNVIRLKRFRLVAALLAIICPAIFIPRVEVLTLRAFRIDTSAANLTDTSQLIPFLSGLFNITYICYCGFRNPKKRWPVVAWYSDLKEGVALLRHTVTSRAIRNPRTWILSRNGADGDEIRYAHAAPDAELDQMEVGLMAPDRVPPM